MSEIIDCERSRRWLMFAKSKLNQMKSLGVINKRLVIDGYGIRIFTLGDEIDPLEYSDKISITAPPGAVVCSRTGDTCAYHYADQYGGNFYPALIRDIADGFIPLIPFSSGGDTVHLFGSDFSIPTNSYGTLSASWYAPSPGIPANYYDPDGYMAAVFEVAAYDADIRQTAGYAFMRGSVAYLIAAPNRHTEFGVNMMRHAFQVTVSYDLTALYSGYNGHSIFLRPVWGEDATVAFSFHIGDPLFVGGICSTTAGAARVEVAYQEVTPSPLGVSYAAFVGTVTQETIAAALGLATPCVSGDDGSDLITAMGNLLGAWPTPTAPYEHGRFSYGVYDVCCWGPVPAGGVKGVVFSFDGTAVIKTVVLPTYNSVTECPVISEVSSGWYCCETHDYAAGSVAAVHYGNPIDSPGWTELALPTGKVVGFSTILATADRIAATAIVYDSGAGITSLHEYDTSKASTWVWRGKIADGELALAASAVFGPHEYAVAGAHDSPVQLLRVQ